MMPEIRGAIPPPTTGVGNNIKRESSSKGTPHSNPDFDGIYDELNAIGAGEVALSEDHGDAKLPSIRRNSERHDQEWPSTQVVGAPIANQLAGSDGGRLFGVTLDTSIFSQPPLSQISISRGISHEASSNAINAKSSLAGSSKEMHEFFGVDSAQGDLSTQKSSEVRIDSSPSTKEAVPIVRRDENQDSATAGHLPAASLPMSETLSVAAAGSSTPLGQSQTKENSASTSNLWADLTTENVQMRNGRQARVNIELDSDSLGPVRLSIAMRRSGLAVNLALDSPDSLASLTRSKDDLRNVIESSGGIVSSLSLHLSGEDLQQAKPAEIETRRESRQDNFSDAGSSGHSNGNDNYHGENRSSTVAPQHKSKEIESQISPSSPDGNRNLGALYL